MQQASNGITRCENWHYVVHPLCFDATVSFLGRNQKVNLVVLVNLRWIHSFVVSHLAFFLNCVTPDGIQ